MLSAEELDGRRQSNQFHGVRRVSRDRETNGHWISRGNNIMTGESHLKPADLILSQDEVRAIDAAAIESLGIPGLLLMENAARGVSRQLHRADESKQVTILCGPGNNGGDGLAVARQRAAEGKQSRVLLETGNRSLSLNTQSNLDFLANSGVPVQILNGSQADQSLLNDLTSDDWIVDSLLGTGIRGGLRQPFAAWVLAINASAARVLAVDVPSGMNCDDGTCGNECVQADLTVTFVAMKRGFVMPSAVKYTGRIVVTHIGIPQTWVREWLQKRRQAG